MSGRARACLLAVALLVLPTLAHAAGAEEGPIRFRPVHVYVDPAGTPLAAYQIEIVADGSVKIVGVEGGEHDAFAPAPNYDPAALAGGRIIIAAFNTGSDLPTARTRVATIHIREAGPLEPTYRAVLQVAGDANARPIPPPSSSYPTKETLHDQNRPLRRPGRTRLRRPRRACCTPARKGKPRVLR